MSCRNRSAFERATCAAPNVVTCELADYQLTTIQPPNSLPEGRPKSGEEGGTIKPGVFMRSFVVVTVAALSFSLVGGCSSAAMDDQTESVDEEVVAPSGLEDQFLG